MARTIAKDHNEKRNAILKTAARFFAESGYDRASMNQLAIECGVSKALIYHYHASKEALLFDILDSHLTTLLIRIHEADRPDLTPDDRLHILAATLLESYRGADYEHRLQLESMGALSKAQQQHLTTIQREIVQIFSSAIKDIRPDLFVDEPDRLMPVTMSMFGMLNWFYQWNREGHGLTRAEYAALASDLVIGGLEKLRVE